MFWSIRLSKNDITIINPEKRIFLTVVLIFCIDTNLSIKYIDRDFNPLNYIILSS